MDPQAKVTRELHDEIQSHDGASSKTLVDLEDKAVKDTALSAKKTKGSGSSSKDSKDSKNGKGMSPKAARPHAATQREFGWRHKFRGNIYLFYLKNVRLPLCLCTKKLHALEPSLNRC